MNPLALPSQTHQLAEGFWLTVADVLQLLDVFEGTLGRGTCICGAYNDICLLKQPRRYLGRQLE
jgi:hypothetical protein